MKYVIDEEAARYQIAEWAISDPDRYIRNSEIKTAVIQINVHHKHKLTRQAPKDPTCTENGNIAYWVCSEGDHPCGILQRFFHR